MIAADRRSLEKLSILLRLPGYDRLDLRYVKCVLIIDLRCVKCVLIMPVFSLAKEGTKLQFKQKSTKSLQYSMTVMSWIGTTCTSKYQYHLVLLPVLVLQSCTMYIMYVLSDRI